MISNSNGTFVRKIDEELDFYDQSNSDGLHPGELNMLYPGFSQSNGPKLHPEEGEVFGIITLRGISDEKYLQRQVKK